MIKKALGLICTRVFEKDCLNVNVNRISIASMCPQQASDFISGLVILKIAEHLLLERSFFNFNEEKYTEARQEIANEILKNVNREFSHLVPSLNL